MLAVSTLEREQRRWCKVVYKTRSDSSIEKIYAPFLITVLTVDTLVQASP